MAERIIDSNGIRLWTEDFGDAHNPTLLLIMGASAQGIQWPEPFIQPFVDAGFHVIRFDNRDTGQSSCFDFAKQPYNLNDLGADALESDGCRGAHLPSIETHGIRSDARASGT